MVRRLALETTAQQDSIGNRLHCELIRLRAALDEMGCRTAQALDVPLCQGLDLILAVGAAAAVALHVSSLKTVEPPWLDRTSKKVYPRPEARTNGPLIAHLEVAGMHG